MCGASLHPKIFFCRVIEKVVTSSSRWSGACSDVGRVVWFVVSVLFFIFSPSLKSIVWPSLFLVYQLQSLFFFLIFILNFLLKFYLFFLFRASIPI